MRVAAPALAALATGAGLALAAPYDPFPLKDGFPSPNAKQVAAIQKAAGGALPNGGLPTSLSAEATVALQLIATNELFEVAFFTSLLQNITGGYDGYQPDNKAYALKTLQAVQKQEELHAAGVNAILASAGKQTIAPCKYKFPTTSYKSAITFAQTFTDLVLSVLPGASQTFGMDGGDEAGLVSLIGSIIAQEGQQDGWYRSEQYKSASAAPFLTTSHPIFAFNALAQLVIVEGSCPNIDVLTAAIPTLGALNVLEGTMEPKDCTGKYSVKGTIDASNYSVVYFSGVLNPVVVKVSNVSNKDGMSYFDAEFPFDSENFSNGLTVAAVVKNDGASIKTVDDVVKYAKFGPGLIEIN